MDMSKGKSLNFGFNEGGQGGTSFEYLGYSPFDATRTDENPYEIGDVVIYDGSLYKFTAAHTGAWTGSDATATSVEELMKEKADAIKVLTREAQNLTDAEKAQVLVNIGAIGEDDTLMTINGTGVKKGDAVTTTETAIVVDAAMSDSSQNPVQNKVVKSEFGKINGKKVEETKSYTSASSIVFFSGLNLHEGDEIIIELSGTAEWTDGWLYGDAGAQFGNKIADVRQGRTYNVILASATNTLGLRVYTIGTEGDVTMRVTTDKGALKELRDYVDGEVKPINIIGLKDYEVVEFTDLVQHKIIDSVRHASTHQDYNLIKLEANAGDKFILDNVTGATGVSILSICAKSYSGADTEYVYPQVIGTTGISHFEWQSSYDCSIVICYYNSYTPSIMRFHNDYVSMAANSKLSRFGGKKIVCFGDSITEFSGYVKDGLRYSDWIEMISGAEIYNVGIGGTQLQQRTAPKLNPTNANEGYAGLDVINLVKAAVEEEFDDTHTYADVVTNSAVWLRDNADDDNTNIVSILLGIDWSTVDAVTVLAGTNDWHNSPNSLGVSGSNDVSTTLGAINEIIRLILSKYPHLQIYWFTPIVRYETPTGVTPLEARVTQNWSDNFKNTSDITLKEFVEYVKTEVGLNHIPICDMYNTLGISEHNFSNYFIDSDNTHPYKGFECIAKKMVGFVSANRTF